MTDSQIIALLKAIKIMANVPYPFPDDAVAETAGHAKRVFTLGEIMGIAMKALNEIEEVTNEALAYEEHPPAA